MQIEALFEFVYILIDQKQVTAKEMAKHFGVSRRTIYRWVETLSIAGIPIYSTVGRSGGISISEKFALDKTVLSEEDRIAIVSSVKALDSLGANSTSKKLSHLVTSDSDWLEVDFAPWSPEGAGVRTLFAKLRDSILKKRQVIFDYCSSQGKVERRTAHPWKLVFKGQAWYLYAWCEKKNEPRFFKLSRIRNILQTSRPVTKAPASQKGSYPKGQDTLLIKIKANVAPSKISFLLDAFVCQQVKVLKDKSATVSFLAPDAPWLCEFLLSFGPDLKVLSPKSVQERILSLAKGVQKVYKGSL